MKTWLKKGDAKSIEEVVSRNTGIPIEEFLNPPADGFISGLSDAANVIMDAVVDDELITIYGDYDVDGISATAILYLLLVNLGHTKIDVILPKRFSEGYGLSFSGVDRIPEGLLVTVDNGISAVDEIAAAKAKGLKVVVIDHHLPREDGQLPTAADVIVDPNALAGSDFNGYCGAGLAFKLACMLLDDPDMVEKLSTLAAIATIADVMPLVNDNRNIVLRGLSNINKGNNLPGIATLLQKLDMSYITESDVGFKLGPIINAAGRMLDAGAIEAFNLLVRDEMYARAAAQELIQLNETRKEVVARGMEICEERISSDCLYGDKVLLVYTTNKDAENLHEGVVGVLAGRLVEKYKVPAIVLAETEDGALKGSGRSYGDIHLKELLDTASDVLLHYGGHAGAAGLSVSADHVEDLRERLNAAMEEQGAPEIENDSDTEYFDLEVYAHQVGAVMEKLKRFAPYGEGNPRIRFKVHNVRLMPSQGKFYRLMGNEGQHIKLFGQHCDLVGFDMAKQYKDANEPLTVDALGYISENRFKSKVTLQVELVDFAVKTPAPPKSPLANALAEKMKTNGFL